jgi:hypothetical protein
MNQPHLHLLTRAGELLDGADVDRLLATAAVRIGVESYLRAAVAKVLRQGPHTPSVSFSATILCSRGILTVAERNGCKRLARATSRAIHTAAVDLDSAERCHDFATELVRRLERRL